MNNEDDSENGCQLLRRLSSYGGEPAMPWFGMDIGGTLAKLVYFEPTDGKTGKFLNQIAYQRSQTSLLFTATLLQKRLKKI